jgi:cytochrome P450
MHLTLDVVSRSLLGSRLSRFDDVERALEVVQHEYMLLWQTLRALVPRWVPLSPIARLKEARAKIDAILLDLIRNKREAPGADLLSHLIALRHEDGSALSDAELLEETTTLFLAGHETTALALTYTLYLLAAHPDAYRKLLAEVDSVLAGRAPEAKDAERLPFTSAVVKESLRLYPPVWTMARLSEEETRVAGFELDPGDQIIFSQWVVQRDPRWFRDPEAFVPERWLTDECRDIPRFSYFPFGGGPRVCIGQHFALLELVLVIARLSQSFVFEATASGPPRLTPVITLRPKGSVPLRVRRRAPPEAGKAERAAE